MKTPADFLVAVDQPGMSAADRARAILWWVGREDPSIGLQVGEICSIIETVGHPGQNSSRLLKQLSSDRRLVNKVPGSKAWRLNPRGRKELEALYADAITMPRAAKATDSVLPRSLFIGTRGYIVGVVHQINASYDAGLFDCCAVMCRRLLETLIIEVYEHKGRAAEIKGPDGNFYMFADLLKVLASDTEINIGRNSRQGLSDFKRLGDLSAHNRRFVAQRADIDRIQAGLRISSEELLHLAALV